MASKPGILTDWPWKPLGSFKYLILAPWVVQSVYTFYIKGKERDVVNFLVFPFLLTRFLHHQIWITVSRYRTAKGDNKIVDKPIEFDQVDRESNWDDQILLTGLGYYIVNKTLTGATRLPIWNTTGVVITTLLHVGPVEFLYYWLHRALHHHFLYSRYHSHHHSSIATQPITAIIHPFAEHIMYYMLFAIPLMASVLSGTACMLSVFGYVTYIDFMNNMGHCNFELIPNSLFSFFPFLKYLIYTPSFHSLHHTQFRTNYSLFMPMYDYLYDTIDKSSDLTYRASLQKQQDSPDVVYLTHLTTPNSIYHMRLGFLSYASKPLSSQNLLSLLWPINMFFYFIFAHAFLLETNTFHNLKLQSWLIPRCKKQYFLQGHRQDINTMIEEAILEANNKGVKVLSLGLLNQLEELNKNGEVYIQKHPLLNVKVIDGTSLVAAVVLNSIPKGTRVLLAGKPTKVAYAIASNLCRKGIQVATSDKQDYIKFKLTKKFGFNLVFTTTCDDYLVWLVGDGISKKEQMKAAKGTLFIPFSQFPIEKLRRDCHYHYTPAMMTPNSLVNLHSCENWLPRRAMSAWRVAGIVHALEEWKVHECGDSVFNIDQIWRASLNHGFLPLPSPTK